MSISRRVDGGTLSHDHGSLQKLEDEADNGMAYKEEMGEPDERTEVSEKVTNIENDFGARSEKTQRSLKVLVHQEGDTLATAMSDVEKKLNEKQQRIDHHFRETERMQEIIRVETQLRANKLNHVTIHMDDATMANYENMDTPTTFLGIRWGSTPWIPWSRLTISRREN